MYYFIHILNIPPPTRITHHSLTPSQVLQEIVENGIKIYSFPDTEGDEEEAVANRKLRVSPSNYHHYAMYHY